jgi:hypothetical protein
MTSLKKYRYLNFFVSDTGIVASARCNLVTPQTRKTSVLDRAFSKSGPITDLIQYLFGLTPGPIRASCDGSDLIVGHIFQEKT